MMKPTKSGDPFNTNFGGDVSQENIYQVSKGKGVHLGKGVKITTESSLKELAKSKNFDLEIMDQEVTNLLNWLAEQQGISPELALKKAVATAAYIHDLTTNQGGRLLVQRQDNSVGEIVLK